MVDPKHIRSLKTKLEALHNWFQTNKEGEFETLTGGPGGV